MRSSIRESALLHATEVHMKANVAVLFLLLSTLAILPGNATNSVSAAGRGARQKTKQLFNGKNMDGWEHVGPDRLGVEDGRLRTEGRIDCMWYSGERV